MNSQQLTTERVEETPATEVHSPISEAGALILMIERAVSNPQVDIDKMERLLEMQERVMGRNAKAAYSAALADMQPKLPIIGERGEIRHGENKPVQSTYARWDDINEAIRPVLAEHGFALSFRISQDAGQVKVTGVLSHREGHSEETTITLPVDMSGSKNGVQGVGSSVSYGQRYTAKALLNLTSRYSEDDDGRMAGAGAMINEDQVAELVALMDEVNADRTKFLNFLKVDTLAHLPAKRLQFAIEALEAKRAK